MLVYYQPFSYTKPKAFLTVLNKYQRNVIPLSGPRSAPARMALCPSGEAPDNGEHGHDAVKSSHPIIHVESMARNPPGGQRRDGI